MWKQILTLLCILVLSTMPVYAQSLPSDIGDEVESSEYSNKGDISVSSENEDVIGIFNDYDTGDGKFSGFITNEGTVSSITEANDANATGFVSQIPVSESTIKNSGEILVESELQGISANANGAAYGVDLNELANSSSLNNSGSISSTVNISDTGEYNGEAEVSGILANHVAQSSIINSGSITSSANLNNIGGDAFVRAFGIEIGGFNTLVDSSLSNSGSIETKINLNDIGGNARIQASGILPTFVENSTISNSGTIDTIVNIDGAGTANGSAYGLYTSHTENSTITNSGNITSGVNLNNIEGNAFAGAAGIGIGGVATLLDSSISNSGSIEASVNLNEIDGFANGRTNGIFSNFVENSAISNSGSIVSSVSLNNVGENNSGDAVGWANGISVGHVENSEILNSGSIVSSTDLNNISEGITPLASAIGIEVRGFETPLTLEDSTIVNTGSIKTNVNLANIAGDAGAIGGGIFVDHAISNLKTTTIDNQGTINVSVTTDNSPDTLGFGAAGIMVEGSEGKIQIKNSGMIKLDVSELGDFEEPAVFESEMGNTHIASAALFAGTIADFSNTGRIYTSGNARALSLYDGSDVTLQNGFGYVFHGKPAETKRPIYTANSTLDLNSVPLIAAGAPDTVVGKPYYLVDQNSTVENTWGALKKEYANPDITVDWYGDNRAEKSAVIFGYEPRESKSARAGMAARTAVNTGQDQLSQYLLSGHVFGGQGFLTNNDKDDEPILLASAGTSDAVSISTRGAAYKNGAYILPYYTGIHDSGLGADITSKGVFLGYERNFDAITAGMFGGYGNNNVRLNDIFKRNGEDQDSYSAGAYGIYNQENWFGELYASYNRIKHDYSGWTGMNYQIRETDEYDSDMFLTKAKAGMKFEDSDWGIYPSMSLRWTNWRTESHTSEVSANPDWNTHYDSLSEDWFQLFAGIDASRKWNLEGDANVSLTGGAGIKQDLNDNEIEVAQSLMGQSTVVEESVASTSAVLNIAGIYTRDAFRAKLGVISEHNEDYDAYNGYLQVGFMW